MERQDRNYDDDHACDVDDGALLLPNNHYNTFYYTSHAFFRTLFLRAGLFDCCDVLLRFLAGGNSLESTMM